MSAYYQSIAEGRACIIVDAVSGLGKEWSDSPKNMATPIASNMRVALTSLAVRGNRVVIVVEESAPSFVKDQIRNYFSGVLEEDKAADPVWTIEDGTDPTLALQAIGKHYSLRVEHKVLEDLLISNSRTFVIGDQTFLDSHGGKLDKMGISFTPIPFASVPDSEIVPGTPMQQLHFLGRLARIAARGSVAAIPNGLKPLTAKEKAELMPKPSEEVARISSEEPFVPDAHRRVANGEAVFVFAFPSGMNSVYPVPKDNRAWPLETDTIAAMALLAKGGNKVVVVMDRDYTGVSPVDAKQPFNLRDKFAIWFGLKDVGNQIAENFRFYEWANDAKVPSCWIERAANGIAMDARTPKDAEFGNVAALLEYLDLADREIFLVGDDEFLADQGPLFAQRFINYNALHMPDIVHRPGDKPELLLHIRLLRYLGRIAEGRTFEPIERVLT